jgi:hypothetical protein
MAAFLFSVVLPHSFSLLALSSWNFYKMCKQYHTILVYKFVYNSSEPYFPLMTGNMFWLAVVYSIFLSCVRWGGRRGSLRTWLVWWRYLAVHVALELLGRKRVKIFGAFSSAYAYACAPIQSARAGGIFFKWREYSNVEAKMQWLNDYIQIVLV